MARAKSEAGSQGQGAAPNAGPKRKKAKKGEESLSFEGALQELERTVSRLEEGEMPLEGALELFETGVKLSRQCHTTLEAASARIEILVGEDGNEASPFEEDEFEEDED